MWYGENDKVSVVKKGKEKGYTDNLARNQHSYRSPATAPESLLGILNANREIRKCTDNDVAFTGSIPEYRFSTGNVSVLIKIQDRPKITI